MRVSSKSRPNEDSPVSIHTPSLAALAARSTPHRRHPRPRLLWEKGSAPSCRRSRCLQPRLSPMCSQTKRPCGSFRHHCPHVISSHCCRSDALKSVNHHIDLPSLKIPFLLLWPRHSLDPQPHYFYLFILYLLERAPFRAGCEGNTVFHTLFLILSYRLPFVYTPTAQVAQRYRLVTFISPSFFQYVAILYVPCAAEHSLASNGQPHALDRCQTHATDLGSWTASSGANNCTNLVYTRDTPKANYLERTELKMEFNAIHQ